MTRDNPASRLYHDLRNALSVVQMNLQALEALESGTGTASPEKRLSILGRAGQALEQAIGVTDRLLAP